MNFCSFVFKNIPECFCSRQRERFWILKSTIILAYELIPQNPPSSLLLLLLLLLLLFKSALLFIVVVVVVVVIIIIIIIIHA